FHHVAARTLDVRIALERFLGPRDGLAALSGRRERGLGTALRRCGGAEDESKGRSGEGESSHGSAPPVGVDRGDPSRPAIARPSAGSPSSARTMYRKGALPTK